MNPKAFSLQKSTFFVLATLCFVGWSGIAGDSSPQDPVAHSDPPSFLSEGTAIVYPFQIFGITSALSDLDGDKKLDVVVGSQVGSDYAVTVSFTRRTGKTILKSSRRPLDGVALFAYDINNDGFPDIIVASPHEPHPFAVWLGDGDGGFTAADQTRFTNDFGLANPRSYQDHGFPSRQELLPGPMRPDCEATTSAYENFALEPTPFITAKVRGHHERMDHSLPTLRSPPGFSQS